MPTMQPRVEIVLGDMFEGPSDLIVLPCSTGGTVTGFVEERLSAFKLPRPHSGMELGQVEFKLLKGVEQLASFVAFAASVKAFTSNLDAIERIGSHLGKFATQTPGAMQIAAPLLGAGAGGLRSEDVVEHLVRGFSQAAPARVVLKIFVRHRNVYNRLQDMLPRLQELTTLPVNDVDSFLPHVRALISYTRTTEAHKAWVKDLAVFLRENGIDARLDEWHLPLGSDVAQWMCNEVELADRVLMICNEEYARRADGRHGGVGWEIRMIQGFLLQEGATNPKKFIPVVRTSDCNLGLPIFLKSAYFLHWPEQNTDEPHLRRKLLEALYEIQDQAPRLGRPPSFVIEALRKQPSDRATRTPT